MPYPGSVDLATLTVAPYDGTTLATVRANAPDGSHLDPTPASTDGGHTWTAGLAYTMAGHWVLTWTVAGTGAGIVVQEVDVSTAAVAAVNVAWRPERWHVADYIPGRTLVGAVDGYGNALATFDATTHPVGASVDRLINNAVQWVTLKTGPIAAILNDAARSVAAQHAAAAVEQGYPDNRDDLNRAQQLYAQAVAARDDLWRANQATTGQAPEDPAAHLLPVWSFPTPDPFGDFIFE